MKHLLFYLVFFLLAPTLFGQTKITNENQNDVLVFSFTNPVSGINLTSSEPISIVIKNAGYNTQSNIPYDVSWDDGYYYDTLPGPIAWGEIMEITLPVTVDMTEYKDYYFEACTYLPGDENPDNDCKTKTITCLEPSLCIDGLYSSGCNFGDGLTYWDLSNINIPIIECNGVPYTWYHDFTDSVHWIIPGMSYELTVQAGYDDTYFDVWIDYNDDYYFQFDETIFDDGYCEFEGTYYTFQVNIPDSVIIGTHYLRFRTNWQAPVTCSCETYAYGNLADFKAGIPQIQGPYIHVVPPIVIDTLEPDLNSTQNLIVSNFGNENLVYNIDVEFLSNTRGVKMDNWLSVIPFSGEVLPYDVDTAILYFNSTGMTEGDYFANLIITSNDTVNPQVNIPVTFTIIDCIGEPAIATEPTSIEFTLSLGQSDSETLKIINIGEGPLHYNITIGSDAAEKNNITTHPANFDNSANEIEIKKSLLIPGGGTDALWDLQFQAPLHLSVGEIGIETDGKHIYTLTYNYNEFCKYEMDGTFVEEFSCGVAGCNHGLAYDGLYFYCGQYGNTLYQLDFEKQMLISTISVPYEVSAITYDYNLDVFYSIWINEVIMFNRSGELLNTLPIGQNIASLAFDNYNGNNYLYGFLYYMFENTNKKGDSCVIVEYLLPEGTATGVVHNVTNDFSYPYESAGGLFAIDNAFEPGTTSIGGLLQPGVMFAYELHDTPPPATWLSVDTCSGFVYCEGLDERILTFDASGLEPGTYNALINITSNDLNMHICSVPVSLTIIDECPFPAPTDLTAEEIGPNTVFLTWDIPENKHAFLYFNLYQDDNLIQSGLMQNQATIFDVPEGDHTFLVSAVYTECEAFSDPMSLLVTKVEEFQTAPYLRVYPNPVSDILNIESQINMFGILITDNIGQVAYQQAADAKSLHINTTSFKNGIYYLQIKTIEGTMIEKLVID